MIILGISCYYHDSAAALLVDGRLVAAAMEERFSRKKHDADFPSAAIRFCLEKEGIQVGDLDYIVFYEKPLPKFERIFLSSLTGFPRTMSVFRKSMASWFGEKLWIKGRIAAELGIALDRILFVDHHLAHAASSFFCSPFQEAAVVTVDGVGEWTTTGVGEARSGGPRGKSGNSVALLQEERFPHSLGLLYSAFTAYLGFRVNNGEYKVMGMAPYGEPRYLDKVRQVAKLCEDGSFRLNLKYFAFHTSTRRSFSRKFVELFGPPRVPESPFVTPKTEPGRRDRQAQENQRFADIAASIQLFTEEALLAIARHAHALTGHSSLCLAGGVALNSSANGRLLREGPFADLYIQPAAGDAGGALGAAQYAYHVLLDRSRDFVMEHAYWGKSYLPAEIRAATAERGLCGTEVDDEEKLAGMMVDDLLNGKVIAIYQSAFEWGPRALGNRSILADPRRSEMKDVVNQRIKFREPFRPFAPVVLEERAQDYYVGLRDVRSCYPLRYMLAVYPVREEMLGVVPAVTHEGGTGRIQTIRREWNPRYYRVVELFHEVTGVPILLNTSFNLRGEPIATTPENALDTFIKGDLDAVYMENIVVRRP